MTSEEYGQLADLVAYQKGSVVSRTLLKTDYGNLTIFAFDIGEGLSEHSTPHEALVWLIEGQARVIIDEEEFVLNSGDFIRLPTAIPHSLQALEKMKMGLVILHGD